MLDKSNFSQRTTITVIGPPRNRAYSMNRYFGHVSSAYSDLGQDVVAISPPEFSWIPSSKLRLVLGHLYVMLRILFTRSHLLHVVDHSDAFYTLVVPRKRVIVTCHDLFAVRAMRGEIPEYAPKFFGSLYQKLVLRGLQKAFAILSVSADTADSVRRLVRSEHPRDQVLYNMIEDLFFDAAVSCPPTQESYVLIVGGADWRKKRSESLRVGHQLIDDGFAKSFFVIGPGLTSDEEEICGSQPIMHVDYLSDSDLACAYRHAELLINMSRYEGFCWPVLEANATGTLALCAPLSVLQEVAPANVFVTEGEAPTSYIGRVAEARDISSRPDELKGGAARFSRAVFRSELSRIITEFEE